MRMIKELMQYYFLVYFKSTKFVMPFVAMLLFLYPIYSTAPTGIVESYTVSIAVVFLIMLWVGLTYNSLLDDVSEQLLLLKTQSAVKYYISRTLFLCILAIFAGTIMTLFPVVQNIINGFQLYTRSMTIVDVLAALLLHCLAGFVGGAVGAFFHQRIVRDQKLAIVITLCIAILSLTKESLHNAFAGLRYVTWVIPPMADVIKNLSGSVCFGLKAVLISAIYLLVYGVVVSVLQIVLLEKRKF